MIDSSTDGEKRERRGKTKIEGARIRAQQETPAVKSPISQWGMREETLITIRSRFDKDECRGLVNGDDSKIDSDLVNQRDLREIVYIIFLVGLLLFSWIQYLLIHNLGSHSHRRKNNPFYF